MSETFGLTASLLGVLNSIIYRYRLSISLLRELIQNAEDAGAGKQASLTFVNDRRKHASRTLFHPNLASAQGPALLAFNDAQFTDRDWVALQHAYESSKSDDSSKIGKYGVGFRSVFHITDCPQILSGDFLAMFDPLQAYTGSSGFKEEIKFVSTRGADQLSPFQQFQDLFVDDKFNGTVVRCPLRWTASKISNDVVNSEGVASLFRDFISEELGISLLFLQNIRQLELYDIDEQGVSTCLAALSISRSEVVHYGSDCDSHIATVTTIIGSVTHVKHWNILHCPFDKARAIQYLLQSFPGDPAATLKDHKLFPNVGIAIPLEATAVDRAVGRLFTYLPLPLPTGFSVHVHALFALTDARQSLLSATEGGIVPGTNDQILIGWNRLLFNHFIPEAWSRLLGVLAESYDAGNIFDAWPPEQRSPATSGESVYWELLPNVLFNTVTSSRLAVWPVYRPQLSDAKFRPLEELITAEPTISNDVLDALTTMGLRLTCPPLHIYQMIKSAADDQFAILTPEVAHVTLLNHQGQISSASKDEVSIILRYLLSSQNVFNVIGLPIFSTVSGEAISLSVKKDAVKSHVIMNRLECDVFGSCDDTAIALHSLPFQITEIFRTQGPKHLNVEVLSVPRIIEYLVLYPNRMALDLYLNKTDAHVIKWLSMFWTWVKDYPLNKELLGKITDLYLLPSNQGLRKVETALFRSRGEHPNYVAALSVLGLSFLDADLTSAAQEALASFGLLKSISNIHEVLNSISLSASSGLAASKSLSRETCVSALRHISTHAQRSCILHGAFTKEQIHKLKVLPIYPMVTFSPGDKPGLVIEHTAIPDEASLRSVTNPPFLPFVEKIRFIQLSPIAPTILGYLDPSSDPHFSDIDILVLTVRNFEAQPDYVHAAALGYIVKNQARIPPFILEIVQDAEFVTSKDGFKKKPGNIVDPDSKLASLYNEAPERQISLETNAEKSISRSLRTLRFMQHSLSASLAQELLDLISADPLEQKSINLARSLWSLITIERLDCSTLNIAPLKRCLPTDQGLRGPGECRDPRSISPHLFDRVLAILEPLEVPSSLKHILGWDQPIPIEILIKQLDNVLDTEEDMFEVVCDIIKHLSNRRDCSDKDIGLLGKVTHDRKWVPTTDGYLTETRNAVFQAPVMESGFRQVMSLDSRMKEFLRQLGCTDNPSYEAILFKLKELQQQSASLKTVSTALALLRSLPFKLEDTQRNQLLLPIESGLLEPFSSVHYNDVGEHAQLIPLQNNFISHPLLDDSLARRLGVARLGLDEENILEPGVDMGEKPVTTVRTTLRDYKQMQFSMEFLANAADANATEFALMVNTFHSDAHKELRALSPAMAQFCTSDALIVYNNSTFSDADFSGILRTSIGGKRDRPSTIGQFGLGALTMFHFTEMAVIVSNNSVLFLNPSKAHLPISGRASLLLPLDRVRSYYPRHLISIDGLFGFNISDRGPYSGTIFVLPLRTSSDFEGLSDAISTKQWTASEIENEILEPFRESASDCLLFSPIRKINGYVRDAPAHFLVSWSFEANRTSVRTEIETGFIVSDVSVLSDTGVDSTWKIAHSTIPEESIPHEILAPLRAHHSPRLPVVVGLAAMVDSASAASNSLFFSTLPLTISTSLPVHVMASFILSPDRRHIRLDHERTPESDFNEWLLTRAIPPLYLFLLQNLLHVEDNKFWWPGQYRETDDTYSHLLIDAFYSKHLSSSKRPLFQNVYDTTILLTPQNVVLSQEEPSSVQSILSFLKSQRVARPSRRPYQLAKDISGIAVVNPAFLKAEILQSYSPHISELDSDIIDDVIAYLLTQAKDATILVGLPFLPLEDGSFGILKSRSDSELYFAWMPRKRDTTHNFPPGYFVSPKLKLRDILKLELNVVPLNARAIERFIAAKLPSSSPFETPLDVANWIHDFWQSWDEYSLLGLTEDDILRFPLVPTVRSDIFVSLASCKNGVSVIIDDSSQQAQFICEFLDNLDIPVVRLHETHLPGPLAYILRSDKYPRSSLTTILKALDHHRDSMTETIAGMDVRLKSAFADWARGNIQDMIPDELLPTVSRLPIWPSASSTSFLDIRPGSEVYMLPRDIPFEIASRFMDICVADYGNLRFVRGPSLTLAQLNERLALPVTLPSQDFDFYRQLLQISISLFPAVYHEPIRVPNCLSVITPSNELYAREPLFLAAFEEGSAFFMHSNIQDLEHALYKHGLKTESVLDVPMFMQCVTALVGRVGDDLVARASVLFEAYGVSLPMRISPEEQHLWNELDDCAFIPRSMATQRTLEGQYGSLEIPQNVTNLNAVVTPLDLVRQEFEAIAWTQRAMFASQPNQRVIVANPELGRPSISEVIAHLRFLSSLKDLSSSKRRIVLHDLEQTYNFLNDNASSASQTLSQLGVSEIFLNVDDPETDDWRWDRADDMVFDSRDIDDQIRHVRTYLMPFQKLLRNAGVLQVSPVHYPFNSWSSITAPESKLASIRSGFEILRKKRSLTDVMFIASDHTEESDSLIAHRSFLAVSSEYFADMFCGGFKEDQQASATSPIRLFVPNHSRECLHLVLDYIYTGVEPDTEILSLNLLLEALELSAFWDIRDYFHLLQKEISYNVTPRTLNQIRTAADHSHAEELIEICKKYEDKNAELIWKYTSRHAPSESE